MKFYIVVQQPKKDHMTTGVVVVQAKSGAEAVRTALEDYSHVIQRDQYFKEPKASLLIEAPDGNFILDNNAWFF